MGQPLRPWVHSHLGTCLEPRDEAVLCAKSVQLICIDLHPLYVALIRQQHNGEGFAVWQKYLRVDLFLPFRDGLESARLVVVWLARGSVDGGDRSQRD